MFETTRKNAREVADEMIQLQRQFMERQLEHSRKLDKLGREAFEASYRDCEQAMKTGFDAQRRLMEQFLPGDAAKA